MEIPFIDFGYVCTDCATTRLKPNPAFQKKPKSWFIGKFCKLAFPVGDGRNEYMYIKVIGLAKYKTEELRGLLANDPQIAIQFACGDLFDFSRKEIIEVYHGENGTFTQN